MTLQIVIVNNKLEDAAKKAHPGKEKLTEELLRWDPKSKKAARKMGETEVLRRLVHHMGVSFTPHTLACTV